MGMRLRSKNGHSARVALCTHTTYRINSTCCLSYCCSCRWAQNMSLNCAHRRSYLLTARWYMCIESHCWMISTRKTKQLVEKPSSTLSTTNPDGLTQARTWSSALRGQPLTTVWVSIWGMFLVYVVYAFGFLLQQACDFVEKHDLVPTTVHMGFV
jgi:hypothetical protein